MTYRLKSSLCARGLCAAVFGCVVAIAADCAFSVEFRRVQTFEDVHGTTCRVCVSGARGTGWFAGYKNNVAFVCTNYHVVTNSKTARLDFWTNGTMQSVDAVVVGRAYDLKKRYDFAVMEVDAEKLKAIDPAFLPIGGPDAAPSKGAVIISSGAPDGRFTQAWKGQVLEYYNGQTAIFSPPPVPGQSGSPICEYVNGELFATGILTWLIGEKGDDDSRGGAIPIGNMYRAFGSQTGYEVDYEDLGSPIPPNATECAEEVSEQASTNASAPCVVMMTQTNCPPCKEAAKDVESLRADNVPVYVYDVTSEYGATLAERFHVDKTPTFIVLDSRYNPTTRFVGAGNAAKIKDAFNAVVPESCPIEQIEQKDASGARNTKDTSDEFVPKTPDASQNIGAVAPPTVQALPAGGQSPSGILSSSPEATAPLSTSSPYAFRNRPPFYDVSVDSSFLADSADRWARNRDGRVIAPKQQDGAEKKPRVGDRVTDSLADSIVDKASGAFDKKMDAIKENIKNAWEAARLALVWTLVFVVSVSLVIALIVFNGLRWAWGKIAAFAVSFFDFLKSADNGNGKDKNNV